MLFLTAFLAGSAPTQIPRVDMCIVPLSLNQPTFIEVPKIFIDYISTDKYVITSALLSTVEFAKRFPKPFLIYKPDSVESLLEVIINALGKRININKSDDVFCKFTNYFIPIFCKYLAIKIFTTNDKQ